MKCHVVYGTSEIPENCFEGNITKHSLLNSKELEGLIKRTEVVICRSGYSSIMDLIELNQRAVLIPTPGQTEQEYLAKHHNENPLFESIINDKDLPSVFKRLLQT